MEEERESAIATAVEQPLPHPPKTGRSALRPLDRGRALVEQVVERIREGILNGEFPPGGQLPPEGKLAEAIGVSYSVIRESMRVLRSLGWVEVSQGRRPRVKPAGPDAVRASLDAFLRRGENSLRDLTELRRPLECEIAGLAAERAAEADIERLEQAIREQSAAKTIEQQIDADRQFHDQLARAAGNSLFPVVLSALGDLLWESRRETISHVGSQRAVGAHSAVLDAIRRHDSQAARQAMRRHIDMVLEDLEDSAAQA